MKILEINTVNYGSTGKIMHNIANKARSVGLECYTAVPQGRHNKKNDDKYSIWIGNRFAEDSHIIFGRITGLQGCLSILATIKFLKRLDELKPSLIHLHNLHNCYVNLPLLFNYIKYRNISVVWTLHDCWAMTGQCPHFTMVKCEKWKSGCYNCPQINVYPKSYVDQTKLMWKLKKKWFTGIKNMTIVTPSKWLANLAKKSYLKDYPIRVINNGIDLDIFKPRVSRFREKYGIHECQFIVLGVAFGWGKRKGLDVFLDLYSKLDKEKYQIVLVGTDDNVDKNLPDGIISIQRTNNQIELAEIYTAADLFVNPTREENYPTVNMESLACGTPVLTFNTGGSPEIINENVGAVVPCDDVDALEQEIIRICETNCYTKKDCVEYARGFDMKARFKEYVNLYEDIIVAK